MELPVSRIDQSSSYCQLDNDYNMTWLYPGFNLTRTEPEILSLPNTGGIKVADSMDDLFLLSNLRKAWGDKILSPDKRSILLL
ncbi:hypothetical protein [Chitinophaga sancti]|uniref:Uncharacterized protein n=1 Tax=Chitinophaga sancti TaxID=1004 RepID=A0A1K1N8A6_9BACT|nr:hypothetical protein [Chitinophaga sancti]WQD63460.1 hypothetical protein U0033_03565 [Chitinophaga sancti]WQG90914.1 hypothetical protein SR876_05350 [Chitinophaga sancti]SFW31672.1 hypothetical protein SAMN05661012_01061 [Chitinophaga sancti]